MTKEKEKVVDRVAKSLEEFFLEGEEALPEQRSNKGEYARNLSPPLPSLRVQGGLERRVG